MTLPVVKKVLFALRWKRRPLSKNGTLTPHSSSDGGRAIEEGVRGDAAFGQERVEAGPAEACGHVENGGEMEEEEGEKGVVTDEFKLTGTNDTKVRRLDKLSERARRFSLPLVLSRKPSARSWKAKEKAVLVGNEIKEEGNTPTPFGGMSLADLPFDVLFTLMALSDIGAVLSLSRTCRTLHSVSESPTLWIDLTVGLQQRSRILALDDLIHPYSLHSNLPVLKRMVLRTDFLERNWRSPRPKTINYSGRKQPPVVKLNYDMDTTLLAGSFFISEQFFLLSTVNGHLVGWDINNTNDVDDEGRIMARRVGFYDMEEAFGLFTFRTHHAERTVYAIICAAHDSPGSYVYNVLRIRLPPPPDQGESSSKKMDFSIIATYNVPSIWRVKTQNIDYSRRRICMLYQHNEDDNLRLYFLLDWDTGEHVEFDSMLHHISKETAMGLRFSEDGESIHVYVMTGSLWVQKTFSTASIVELHRSLCAPHRAIATSSPEPPSLPSSRRYAMFTSDQTLAPALVVSEELDMPPFITDPNIELYQYWNLSQWWLRYTPATHNIAIPTRFSRVFFFYMHPHAPDGQDQLSDEEEKHQRRKAWHVVQYYTTSERPLSRKVFVCQLLDCSTIRLGELGFPIMGASFNHLVWVETTTVTMTVGSVPISKDRWRGKRMNLKEETRTKRVLRLVAFPEPGVASDEEYSMPALPSRAAQMRTLEDVPESVLDKAVHIFLEPAMAAVLITTSDNEMHRFNYA